MTGKKRILTALSVKQPDRVPLYIHGINEGPIIGIGRHLTEGLPEPKQFHDMTDTEKLKLLDTLFLIHEHFGVDGFTSFEIGHEVELDKSRVVDDRGIMYVRSPHGLPVPKGHPVQEAADLTGYRPPAAENLLCQPLSRPNPAGGERIHTFKEILQLFRKSCNPSTRLLVEIKTSPEEPALTPPPEATSDLVVKMLKEEGITERAWVLSFDWRNLVHIQKIAPELVTVYLTVTTPGSNTLKPNQPGPSPWMAGWDIDDFNGSAPRAVKAAGGRIWSPFFKNLTPESLTEARQLGLKVSVWTPDQREDLKQMISMKVDAITTNRPDVLKDLLKRKKSATLASPLIVFLDMQERLTYSSC